MTRLLLALACTLAVAACGGSDAKKTNAAAEARFTYGSPQPATAAQSGAGATVVGSATGFAAAPAASGGVLLADTSPLVAALLGSGVAAPLAARLPALADQALVARPPALAALVDSGFDNPGCATVGATSVTYTRCTITLDRSGSGVTQHSVLTLDGTASFTAATGTTAWDLTMAIAMSVTNGIDTVTAGGSFHMAGSIATTATTVKGHSGTEYLVTVNGGGQSASLGADESLDLDLTYADAATCDTRITSGTVEAKRVITAWPQTQGAPIRPADGAVKVTWTACGQATVQIGTR